MNALLTMGQTGSAALLVWAVLNHLVGKRLPALWHMSILRAALFLTLFPARQFITFLSKWREIVSQKPPVQVLDVSSPALNPAFSSAFALQAAGHPTQVSAIPEALLQGIAFLWAAGAAVMLLSKAWSYVHFRRVLQSCKPVADQGTLAVFQTCRERAGLKQRVRLLSGSLFSTPVTTGLLRPAVILPEAPLSEEELRCVLLHEMTHIRNRDLWSRFFAMLSRCLHWWNPAAAILRRALQDWEERACDEQVATILDSRERKNYGLLLLRWAEGKCPSCAEWAASLSTGRALKGRLERVLHPRSLTGRRMRMAAMLLAVPVLIAAGTVAARMPQIARKDNPNPFRALTAQERLVLRRGGTLMADTDPEAWSWYGAEQAVEWHKLYIDRNGDRRGIDEIGNVDKLDGSQRQFLSELVNGDLVLSKISWPEW